MTFVQMMMSETLKLKSIEEESAGGFVALGERAQDERLKQALADRVRESEAHARQMEYLCERKGWVPDSTRSRALEGLQGEVREMMADASPGPVTDARIVALARKLAHLKIASYETVLILAIGDHDLVRTLALAAGEEKKADEDLDWVLRSAIGHAASESRNDAARSLRR